MKKITVQLEELVCPMCATKIETALGKEMGVEKCSVSYNASRAKVEFDEEKVDVARLRAVIEALGYEVQNIK